MSNVMTPEQFKQFQDSLKQEEVTIQGNHDATNKATVAQATQPPVELDWPKAELHIANVEANLMKYAGKEDHNPYIMMNELNFHRLKKGLELHRAECFDAIMALPLDAVPHVNNLKSLEVG